jgi:hypothetical protein
MGAPSLWSQLQIKFAVVGSKIPVPRNNFPVSLSREFLAKRLQTALFCANPVSKCLRIAEFPVKFPDSREIARRQVRSALQPQPGSLAASRGLRETRDWVGNAAFPRVRPRLQAPKPAIAGRQSAKSPAAAETRLDHGCRPPGALIKFSIFPVQERPYSCAEQQVETEAPFGYARAM